MNNMTYVVFVHDVYCEKVNTLTKSSCEQKLIIFETLLNLQTRKKISAETTDKRLKIEGQLWEAV